MKDNTNGKTGILTILHIFSGDLWAGAEVMIFNLLNRLKDYPDMKIIALSLNKGILSDKLKESGIETYIISEQSNSFFKIFLMTLKVIKGRKIDVIHSHRYKENLLALLLKMFKRVKMLTSTMHGLSEFSSNTNKASIDLRTKINYFILRYFFSNVVAVSREMKTIMVEHYKFNKDKVDKVYNGIESDIQQENKPNIMKDSKSSIFKIGSVGRMVQVKDFNLFLEIAAQIRLQSDKVHFSILGDGPLKENLIQRTKELKIDDCLEFLLPRADPFPYYQSLDLYLNTSIHEGIPMSILEAMACGKPVIAPKVGGIPEIISNDKEGYVIENRQPKEFADICIMLMKDKDLRTAIGINASKRVAMNFSSSIMAESYSKLYNSGSHHDYAM